MQSVVISKPVPIPELPLAIVETSGRCRELDYCSIGQMRTVVRVPLGRPFICPECGKPLHALAATQTRRSRRWPAIWAGAGLAGAALLYVGLGPARPKHHHIVLPIQEAPAAPPPLITLATGESAAAVVLQVESITEVLPTLAVTQTDPLSVAPPPPPPPLPPPLPLPLPLPRLTPLPRVAAPSPRLEPLPTLSEAPPAIDRGFSPATLSGGVPPYPVDYVHDGRIGEVSLSCTIEASGEPSHCKVQDVAGGRRFAEAAVDWLNSGAVHYAPILRHGRPIAEEAHWTIRFRPPR